MDWPSRETETTEDKQRMKRINNIWENIIDENRAYESLVEGTRHKRGKRQVRKLLYSSEEVQKDRNKWHLIDPDKGRIFASNIAMSLKSGTWKHDNPRYKRTYCPNRTTGKGKWRNLYIPTLKDHIVHHMVMSASMEAFTKGMHPHCCGSVPGRGIKHILVNVGRWMQKDSQCRYFVKLDIIKFFDSIEADVLKQIIREKIKDKKAIKIHDAIIDSAPVACPVGYYTSPWYSNLYLQDFDWFVEQELYKTRRGKRIKYVRHYLRYADDILLIGTSKSDLKKAVKMIISYLSKNYNLKVKSAWEIKKIGKHENVDGVWRLKPDTYWCDIGGYKFCKDSTILRDGVYLSTKRLAKKISKKGYFTTHQAKAINAKVAWAEKCDSKHFIETEVLPYVNIKDTRRVISDVDKINERRINCSEAKRNHRESCNSQEKH